MSVPVVAVVAVLASIAVVAAAAGVNHLLTARTAAAGAPAPNTNCTLIVPANPLTAQGLATPYQLTATDPADGPCNEANPNQTAFVQGAVIDPATGQVSVYDPLVVDAGTQPAAQPVVPTLPQGAVVAVWFGFNGGTLSLAGPDQVPATPSQGATPASASQTATPTTATATATGSATAPGSATGTGTASATASGSATATATATASQSPTTGLTASVPAAATGTPAAAVQAEGAAPLPPGSSGDSGYSATLTRIGRSGSGQAPAGRHPRHSASPTASPPASASPSTSASQSATASPSAAPSTQASPSSPAGMMSGAPASGGDAPAASGNPDAVLRQADCIAGQDIGGQFTSFTQVGACNAIAFFRAANAAIRAGRLRVPSPGTASDGMKCLTTRSFALIDQDQSDNVTTEYLAEGDGQIAQDSAANRQALTAASTLFNGSDNGLLDLFVDPSLGCSPWQVPNLADGGAPTSALPLDELQAARYAGGRGNPAALVPLNDPMTLGNNGQFSTDKTNTYRSIVDMPPLPAGESPRAYCVDMEHIQGARLQQDVNLLTANPGPAPAEADNLFTFMAMRLQQSFTNLNCASYGLRNDVSTTVDANGIVVAACFLTRVAPVTTGPGNPAKGMTTCPATTPQSSAAASPSLPPVGSAPSASASAQTWQRQHPRRHHWWW